MTLSSFFKIATTGLSYKYDKGLVWIIWPSHFYCPLFCQRIHYLFNSALPIQFIGRIFFEYTRIGNTYSKRIFYWWIYLSFYFFTEDVSAFTTHPVESYVSKKKTLTKNFKYIESQEEKNQGQLKASIIIIIEVKHLRWNEMGNGFIFIVWLENDSSYLLYDGNPNPYMLMTLKTYPRRLRALFYFCFKSSNITSLCSIITTWVVIIKAFSNALVDRAEETPF